MFSNQPWSRLTSPPSNFDPSILREILARLDIQRDNIFELKGLLSGSGMATDSELAKLSNEVHALRQDVSHLGNEIVSVRELLGKSSSSATTPGSAALTRSSTDSHGSGTADSPRRRKRSHPPVSFPTNLDTIPDASPGKPPERFGHDPWVEGSPSRGWHSTDAVDRTPRNSGSSKRGSPRKGNWPVSREGSPQKARWSGSQRSGGSGGTPQPRDRDVKRESRHSQINFSPSAKLRSLAHRSTSPLRRFNITSAPAAHGDYDIETEDLADFGVHSSAHARKGESTFGRYPGQGYFTGAGKQPKSWRSVG